MGECPEGYMQRASPTCREERGGGKGSLPPPPHSASPFLLLEVTFVQHFHLSENLEAVPWSLGVSGTQKHQGVRR